MAINPKIETQIKQLEQLLKNNPASAQYRTLAELYHIIGEGEKAYKTCVAGLSHHPKDRDGFILLGRIAFKIERYETAEKAFVSAYRVDPSKLDALFMLCQIYIKSEQTEKLRTLLQKLKNTAPQDVRLKKIQTYIDKLSAAPLPGEKAQPRRKLTSEEIKQLLSQIISIKGVNGLVLIDSEGRVFRNKSCPTELAETLVELYRNYRKALDTTLKSIFFGMWNEAIINIGLGFIFILNIGNNAIALSCGEKTEMGGFRASMRTIISQFEL